MIDRLSILALKILHMRAQTERTDATPEHVEACRQKLARLVEQRGDLEGGLGALFADCGARAQVYRQFKMYNDPPEPYLYGAKTGGGEEKRKGEHDPDQSAPPGGDHHHPDDQRRVFD
jgi:hypothetical protein